MTHNASKTSSEKPLLGAVLCCTSITPEDRTRLAEYAEQMGAEHKLDLTSDVTHLLVGSTDTPKYEYVARERDDVKVLRPEWVEAVRERWMEDRALDMNALEAEYRVPTLAGLKICITGFDDLTFRGQLQKNVLSNGGQYTGDLTKDVTHLIAARPEGKKYEYATLWQKKVVSLQWYKDTLDRGMQLDEKCYHPSRPLEEQGLGAWNRQEKGQPQLGKRSREEQPAVQEPTRKLRRTASTKLGSQTMWGDIVGQVSHETVINQDGLRSTRSMPAMRDQKQSVGEQQQVPVQYERAAVSGEGFLKGFYFAITSFEQRKETLVLQTLQAAGAVVLGSIADLTSHEVANPNRLFLIVPHQTRPTELPKLGKSAKKPTIVTELWLERCMVQKAFISLSQYPLGGIITPSTSPETKALTINATGFQSIETLHIAKTVAMIGAKYAEVFTPKSSVLVCNSMNVNQQKLFHAKQWKVPAVSESWLCKFVIEGSMPEFNEYLMQGSEDDNNDLEAEFRQKRLERKPRQPPDDSDEGHATKERQLRSMPPQSPASTMRSSEKAVDGQQNRRESRNNQDKTQDRQQNNKKSSTREDTALREISPNSPSRRGRPTPSPVKKTLFKTYDGAGAMEENQFKVPPPQSHDGFQKLASPKKTTQDAASINSAIQDLLNMKARAKVSTSAHETEVKGKKKRLLGRALSNLSNASHGSRQSRASSIDSLNTDGVGSEIAPPSGRSTTAEGISVGARNGTLQARAQSKPSSGAHPINSMYHTTSIDLSDPHLLRDEFEAEVERPQLTQLGYEDSEEAIALREKLAEKRRARGRLGQNAGDPKPQVDGKEKAREKEKERKREGEKQVIRDDDLFSAAGWGGGRRTRAKNRSVDGVGDLELF